MENTSASATDNFRSGRFNPEFSQQVTSFMLNPFVKYKGLEVFGTYELASGRKITEADTHIVSQYAVDAVMRFPKGKENLWVGGRFKTVSASPINQEKVTINRYVASAGWFMTTNILMKAEYVYQQYDQFAATNIREGGNFGGFILQATVGF